jgi:hypothetical protein
MTRVLQVWNVAQIGWVFRRPNPDRTAPGTVYRTQFLSTGRFCAPFYFSTIHEVE